MRLGISICEDLWDEYYHIKPVAELAAAGADLLININASPFCPGKRHERDAVIRAHIAETGKPLVYVNTTGAADNGKNIIPFDGESLVYDAGGKLVAIGPQFTEELLVVDLDLCGDPGGSDGGAAADRPRSRNVRRARDGAPRLHAQDRVHHRRRGGVRRDRLGPGARDCGRRARQ